MEIEMPQTPSLWHPAINRLQACLKNIKHRIAVGVIADAGDRQLLHFVPGDVDGTQGKRPILMSDGNGQMRHGGDDGVEHLHRRPKWNGFVHWDGSSWSIEHDTASNCPRHA